MTDIAGKEIGAGDSVIFVAPDTKDLMVGKVSGFANGKAKIEGKDGFRYRATASRIYIIRKTKSKKK